MPFQAFEISIQLIESLRDPIARLRAHDADLAAQLRRSASSVAQNLSEGRRRIGKDRLHHYRIAAGSADESVASLRVAEAWGFLDPAQTRTALQKLDSLLAILWRLTH